MNSHFNCDLCTKIFSERRNLKQHQLANHELKRYECSFCKKQFTRKSKLNNHVCDKTSAENHYQNNENRCLNCNQSYSNISNLKKHLKKCTKSTFIDRDSLKEKIVQQTKEYDDQIEMGKAIFEILNSDSNTKEEALDENQKKSLYLYKSSFTFNIDHINLRS